MKIIPSQKILKTIFSTAGITVLFLGIFSLIDHSLAQETTKAGSVEYRDIPWIGSRNLIWIVAQIHLLFGGFVLGVPIFALICEIIGVRTKDPRYDRLAREFTKLLTASYATTAILGGILLFLLIGFYPKLMSYLTDVFFPSFIIYGVLFLLETPTLYLYWYGWDWMMNRKGLHIFLGVLLNVFGFAIMIVSNAWATFQSSPVVLPETLGVWERAWEAMNNPTWWPINVHRVIANIVLGGYICGAYAGLRYLGSRSLEEREHYDWMGYVGNFIGIFGLLPLPFAGYWLTMEIYRYNQQMGITLMGGFLSWLFIIQAILIGVLFLGSNYYYWLGLAYRIQKSETYKKYIASILVLLLVCFGVWMTPHTLVASLQESRALGGAHHPVLGVLGVMSAKMTVVNLMILATFASFLLYWRADKMETVGWAKGARIVQIAIFAAASGWIIFSGIYGYFVPALVRIYILSVSQVLVVLGVLLLVTLLTVLSFRKSKSLENLRWGLMPVRASYTLVLNAVMVILLMSLMGYARSASRVHWHVYGVMEDTSPYAFSPALGTASIMIVASTLLFCLFVSFIFGVASLAGSKGSGVKKSSPVLET
jgi:cytochrome bd ubiquinol oxidase subunit I